MASLNYHDFVDTYSGLATYRDCPPSAASGGTLWSCAPPPPRTRCSAAPRSPAGTRTRVSASHSHTTQLTTHTIQLTTHITHLTLHISHYTSHTTQLTAHTTQITTPHLVGDGHQHPRVHGVRPGPRGGALHAAGDDLELSKLSQYSEKVSLGPEYGVTFVKFRWQL